MELSKTKLRTIKCISDENLVQPCIIHNCMARVGVKS